RITQAGCVERRAQRHLDLGVGRLPPLRRGYYEHDLSLDGRGRNLGRQQSRKPSSRLLETLCEFARDDDLAITENGGDIGERVGNSVRRFEQDEAARNRPKSLETRTPRGLLGRQEATEEKS